MSLVLVLVVLAVAQDRPTFRVKVDLVVLSFTITDNKGHYINGLQPKDFRILEDGIPDFVRGLDRADSVAVYTYSRNLTRAASLTKERNEAVTGLRNAVAGDDS